ncbi:sensor histidine kinase [Microbacterium sp. ZW T5_45]|uniref:sensor histidine kinase n=1 Tax=Microbacterium sp. ZW T5_45 TaxID=3378080 RepID=UPI003851AE5B
MPDAHPPVNRIVVGMRIGLQFVFLALLVFAVAMSVVSGAADAALVICLSAAVAITYLAAMLVHGAVAVRLHPSWRWIWVLLLTAEWAVLVWLSPHAAYLVFPIFFLQLELLRPPFGALAVWLSAAWAVIALGLVSGWSIGGVIGPLIGAAVATLLGKAYNALREEAAEHERLYTELSGTQQRLAAAERDAGAAEERARVARDLHDTVAQNLSSIVMLLTAAEREADTGDTVRLARQTASETLAETRALIGALAPPLLDEHTLGGALRRLAANAWRAPGLQVDVRVAESLDLSMTLQTALLRIAQGGMANVLQHARASRAWIEITRDEGTVRMVIGDDGAGMDPAAVENGSEARRGGFGIRATRERVEQLGGRMHIAGAPGKGTLLTVEVPDERRAA